MRRDPGGIRTVAIMGATAGVTLALVLVLGRIDPAAVVTEPPVTTTPTVTAPVPSTTRCVVTDAGGFPWLCVSITDAVPSAGGRR